MYEEFFQFSSPPFRLNPDPKFFFGSRSHNKAMAYLHYGLRQGEGFIVITGEIGAGKSMLISHLLDQLDRSNVVAAHLLTTHLKPTALLSHILSAFRIEPSGAGESAAIEAFEDFLFDQMNRGRRVLLIVDEAQNLPAKTIEELRMLSNMDYDGTPLFQVFLVGQPEFRKTLAKPDMEQFRQRVIASYHLEPLSQPETTDYIKHRLSLVGWSNDPTIDDEAFAEIYKATGGVPRKINKLCNRIFLYCGIEKRRAVDAEMVKTVIADLRKETVGGVETPDQAAEDMPDAEDAASPASAPEPRCAAAGGARRRANGGDSGAGRRAPVVIPFEKARKISAKDAEESERKAPRAEDKPADDKPADSGEKAETAPATASGAKEEANKTAPAGSAEDSALQSMSVLDRLRARRRQNAEAEKAVRPVFDEETAAKLSDVARAIEEAAAGVSEATDAEIGEAPSPPALEKDPAGWRRSMAKSIDETRDELKAAHRGVSALRQRLSEIERRRAERREQVRAKLTRAESLLGEIRNARR